MTQRERMIRRVQALRAKADSSTFPAEVEALREKALSLMTTHGLTEADVGVVARPPAQRPARPARPWAPVVVFYGNGNATATSATATTIRFNGGSWTVSVIY